MAMTVVKIGGSVLTEKDGRNSIDRDSLETVAEAVSRENDGLVLVHGAGSFGHPQAAETGLSGGNLEGLYSVHRAVKELNTRLVSVLQDRDVLAAPVHPSSCACFSDGLEMMTSHLEAMVDNGVVPVIHGDGVIDTEKGVSVLSGDRIVLEVAEALGDDHVGMCIPEGGVLDEDGEPVPVIDTGTDIHVMEKDAKDVTGGIENKVRRLSEVGSEAYIFGPEDLESFLGGGTPGTEVR
ncbi:MAG: isopentenyl phosphate kinase [Candidatus Nanohaloarchaea archaeon]